MTTLARAIRRHPILHRLSLLLLGLCSCGDDAPPAIEGAWLTCFDPACERLDWGVVFLPDGEGALLALPHPDGGACTAPSMILSTETSSWKATDDTHVRLMSLFGEEEVLRNGRRRPWLRELAYQTVR